MGEDLFLAKAQEALRAAQVLLHHRQSNSVANRAYYAGFHAARAALIRFNVSAAGKQWSHKALQSALSQLFRNKKIEPAHLKGYLTELLAIRELADYGQEMVSSRVAKDAVRQAAELVASVEKLISS
jgi:uncharacterized protein (UPF0332 family)